MIKTKYAYTWLSLLAMILELGVAALAVHDVVESAGSSSLRVGCMGVLDILIGILGFLLSWTDRKLLGRKFYFPLIMMILHSMVLILLTAVYLLGVVSQG